MAEFVKSKEKILNLAKKMTKGQFINDMNRQLTHTIYNPSPIASHGTILGLLKRGVAFWNTKMNHKEFWDKKHESNKINEDKILFSNRLILKKKNAEDISFKKIMKQEKTARQMMPVLQKQKKTPKIQARAANT